MKPRGERSPFSRQMFRFELPLYNHTFIMATASFGAYDRVIWLLQTQVTPQWANAPFQKSVSTITNKYVHGICYYDCSCRLVQRCLFDILCSSVTLSTIQLPCVQYMNVREKTGYRESERKNNTFCLLLPLLTGQFSRNGIHRRSTRA